MTTKDDATQDTGVSATAATDATTETAAEREQTDRERMMDAIVVDREEAEAVDQVEKQMAAPTDPESILRHLDKSMVTVKIDGVESQVSVEEMRRQYQKNGAAERRLEEATRLLEAARTATPPVGVEQEAKPADIQRTQQAASGDVEQEGRDFLAALFEGDEEKALESLKRIGLGRANSPTLDANQLAAQLTPAIKQQLSYDSALEKFKGDYAEIVGDPYLADLADRFLDAEVAGGKPFPEALEEAGKKTRDWLGSKGVTTTAPPPTTDRNTKLERKAGIDRIPALATKATTVEEPVQSASDIIAEMRKARGLTI